ncbi:response regulator [Candidatus Saccharibacteria bacterium]|nr:response regulator [Candidatus Saccharibacteria bacterium]
MSQHGRIVVVEDDTWLAQQYARTLERAGFEVHHAPNAIVAIDMIDTVVPMVLIVDMLLAGTTALALLHELASHNDLAHIPIILVTNLADQISLDDVKSYGVRRILDKATMHPQDIEAAVRSVL